MRLLTGLVWVVAFARIWGGGVALGQVAPTATANFTAQSIGSNQWQYTITVQNTSSSQTIGTFWFSWLPSSPADFMPGPVPTGIVSPSFWSAQVVGSGNSSDGYSIQWVSNVSSIYDIPAGGQMQFQFDSTLSPSTMAGISSIGTSTPIGVSYVYHAGPFSDAGTQITATPEPASIALLGSVGMLMVRRRRAS